MALTRTSSTVINTQCERQFKNYLANNTGLNFVVEPGIYTVNLSTYDVAQQTVALTDNAVSVVYLDTSDRLIKAYNLAGTPVTTNIIGCFTVTTVSGAITAIVDMRMRAFGSSDSSL